MKPTAYLATVRHVRVAPLHNDFTYRTCTWAIPLNATDPNHVLPWWHRGFVRFRAGDHLGRSPSWRQNIVDFAHARGVDVSGCDITALCGGATSGYAFDPLTLYWCAAPSGESLAVIAEVRNTYGERHTYLLQPDERDIAHTEKCFYVSPFNDVTGSYTMSVPPPDAAGFDIRVTLHRPGSRPFVATWRGVRPQSWSDRLRLALHLPVAAQLVTARIRVQGIRLWLRRLPVQPRPHHREETT
ncbi:DUF1365 domain-containing protein [Flexivirga caeni]|uniref:DUF1365 domain-containing protein n=1 Tax=Flexivirga caeni TaxID=2294115 RepID=A0A3M9M4P0_9MICO|nr:DUF1365 domain-containing protein [Flexivirga caeni]RNI19508.1 DUF1365 domain-containing protein [Flexivirga caeni]